MKFPTNKGIGQVRADQQVARRCYIVSLDGYNSNEKINQENSRKSKTPHECQMIDSTLLEVERQDSRRPEPGSELEDYKIYGDDDSRTVRIGADLTPNNKI